MAQLRHSADTGRRRPRGGSGRPGPQRPTSTLVPITCRAAIVQWFREPTRLTPADDTPVPGGWSFRPIGADIGVHSVATVFVPGSVPQVNVASRNQPSSAAEPDRPGALTRSALFGELPGDSDGGNGPSVTCAFIASRFHSGHWSVAALASASRFSSRLSAFLSVILIYPLLRVQVSCRLTLRC
jgi:hypothetical protein